MQRSSRLSDCQASSLAKYQASVNRFSAHSIATSIQYRRISRSRALDAIRRLIESSDVVVHNMKPGAMERLGLVRRTSCKAAVAHLRLDYCFSLG